MISNKIRNNLPNCVESMKNHTNSFTLVKIPTFLLFLLMTNLLLQNAIAQDYTRWDLPEGAKLRIGKGNINNLQFTSDNERLIVDSDIGIWIYDAISGIELDFIGENRQESYRFNPGMILDPNNMVYYSWDSNNTMHLRDITDGNIILTLQGDTVGIRRFTISGDGKTLAGIYENEIRIWDLNTGEQKTSILIDIVWSRGVVLSPDGKMLAVLRQDSDNRLLQLRDVSTGAHIKTLTEFAQNMRELIFSRDGNTLISTSETSIQLWDISTGKRNNIIRFSSASEIAISPDSETAVIGGFDGLNLWDLTNGTLKTEFSGHVLGVGSIVFSPNGKTIASGGYGELNIWDVESGARKLAIENHTTSVNGLTFSPDNRTLAMGHWYKINLWDTDKGQLKTSFFGSSFSYNYDLDYSRDGTILASIIWGVISLWEINSGVPIAVVSGYGDGIRGTRSGYREVAYSPDGSLLAGGNGDATIHLWYGGRTIKGSLVGHTDSVTSIAFNDSGRFLASGSYDRTVRLWDVVDETNIKTFEGHTDVVNSVDISPNARYIASGSKDKSIIIWDVQNANQKYTLTGHTDEVYSVAFSLDGQILVSGGGRDDPTVRLWNVNTGEEITSLTGHSRGNTNIAFALDGKTFASGSADGTAIIWDLTLFINSDEYVTHSVEDVNRDGIVTIDDLILVATQFGQSGIGNSADVNGDGAIDVKDILLVAAALASDNGAPSNRSLSLKELSASDVQQWLNNALQVNSDFPNYKRGITVLEHLLTLLIPEKTVLLPNYPNPFNPETWIPYQLAIDSDVTIHIHSSNGQLIRTLQLGNKTAGIYNQPHRAAHWNGKNELGEPVASGTYYCTLSVGSLTNTHRMVIRK